MLAPLSGRLGSGIPGLEGLLSPLALDPSLPYAPAHDSLEDALVYHSLNPGEQGFKH